MKHTFICAAVAACSLALPVYAQTADAGAPDAASTTDATLLAQANRAKPATTADASVAAEVNGEKIMRADVERAVTVMRNSDAAFQSGSDAAKAALESIRQQHLENLIVQALLAQDARKRNITAPKAEVDKSMAAIQEGMTQAEFSKSLADDGKTVEDIRRMVSEDLMIRELSRRITGDLTVTDAEINDYYRANAEEFTAPESARASHILFAFKEGMSAADKTKLLAQAQDAAKQAKAKNADFAALAKKYSQDPGSKDAGGDLGEFAREQMVKEFADAVWANPVGSVVGPVQTEFGYHIIRVTAKKPAALVPLDFNIEGMTVRDIIRARLLRSKTQTRLDAHVKALRAAAVIKKYL
jgi:peptidyl-prolyl cis-trans isomerase C